jgi:hypothetical protein
MLCYKVVCILKWVLEKNFSVPGLSSGWPVFNCVRLRNNTLLAAFIKHYNKEGIKFQGDIPCIAYVLNLVI